MSLKSSLIRHFFYCIAICYTISINLSLYAQANDEGAFNRELWEESKSSLQWEARESNTRPEEQSEPFQLGKLPESFAEVLTGVVVLVIITLVLFMLRSIIIIK